MIQKFRDRRNVRRDMVVCVRLALFIATTFSAWVFVLYLTGGDDRFDRLGTSIGAVILLYFCAAILLGALVGILLPLARAGRLGAALVGTVTAAGLYAMALVALNEVTWTLRDAVVILGLALLLGPVVGIAYRSIFSDA
jgi:hypothetical protein